MSGIESGESNCLQPELYERSAMKSNEIVQDDDFSHPLSNLTPEQNELWIVHLRRLWEEGKSTETGTRSAEETLDQLERKYVSILEKVEPERGRAAADVFRNRLKQIAELPVVEGPLRTDTQ